MSKLDLGEYGYFKMLTQINLPAKDDIFNFTGVVAQFWSSGILSEQRIYVRGKSNGPLKNWFENGKIAVEGNYCNGLMHGTWTFYDRDGSKNTEKTFEYGKPVNEKTFAPVFKKLVQQESLTKAEIPRQNNMIVKKIEPTQERLKLEERLKSFEKHLEGLEKQSKKVESPLVDGMKLDELMEKLKEDPEFLASSEVVNTIWDSSAKDSDWGIDEYEYFC